MSGIRDSLAIVCISPDSASLHPGCELFSYYVAVSKGTDVDQPRNLGRLVTVEWKLIYE